jgi:hypothetical protein
LTSFDKNLIETKAFQDFLLALIWCNKEIFDEVIEEIKKYL